MASVALTSYFLFPGTRPGFLLSATLYLPKIWYTVLLLLTLQCAMISLTEYPLLYMSTAILSRSVLLNILLVFTGTLILCCRRITRSDDLRNTATSSGRDPNMVSLRRRRVRKQFTTGVNLVMDGNNADHFDPA